MDHFSYRDSSLWCEDVAVSQIARQVGTPVYIYSAATLLDHYERIATAFARLDPLICFAVKSLSNVHILKLLAGAGSGFDIVSGGELARVTAAGADPAKVVFAGAGKTDAEITRAIDSGIAMFNVESAEEFENISRIAAGARKAVRAALRVNPDVETDTHRYTTTGRKETKFGVDIDRAEAFFEAFGRDEWVRLDAVHFHIGSPIRSTEPYVVAVNKTLELIGRLRGLGFEIGAINIGGGFSADYQQSDSPTAADYAEAIVPALAGADLEIILEPGRQIAANAGLLLSKVLYRKRSGERNFIIVDAAMTDLIRPALYGAEHFVYPAELPAGTDAPQRTVEYAPDGGIKADIVGGVCEGSDFLAKDRFLPPVSRGDLMAVFSAGAYGFVMSSQYNSRPRAAEVLVEGNGFRTIRRRETYDDLLAAELDV